MGSLEKEGDKGDWLAGWLADWMDGSNENDARLHTTMVGLIDPHLRLLL
jgi:hypothetical protein